MKCLEFIERQPRSFKLQKLSRYSEAGCSPLVPKEFVDSNGRIYGWRAKLGNASPWVYGIGLEDVLKAIYALAERRKKRFKD